MFDLNGEYLHKVDAKGRLSMPAKFRKNIEQSIVAEAVQKSQEGQAPVG
ncbi:MAG: MraZ N-terminal domain containing protein, partial [Eggerthellaceae bacterium]|nr:MraZ N-terminal domain containing protein [Eggerthellaceae bacterium]